MSYLKIVNYFYLVSYSTLIIISLVLIAALMVVNRYKTRLTKWYKVVKTIIALTIFAVPVLTFYDCTKIVSCTVKEEVNFINNKSQLLNSSLVTGDPRYTKIRSLYPTTYNRGNNLDIPEKTVATVTFKVKDRFYTNKRYINEELERPFYIVKEIKY